MNIKSVILHLVVLFFCTSSFAGKSVEEILKKYKRCTEPGCTSERAKGDIYCIRHRMRKDQERNQALNGCVRMINGIKCGSPRHEGGLYCYNCQQVIDREQEQKLSVYKRKQEAREEARRNLNLQKQAQQAELDRMSSRIWFVNFETLQEKHDRIMAKKPAPKFPVDGLGD